MASLCNIFMRMKPKIAALHAPRKFRCRAIPFFMQQKWFEKYYMQHQKEFLKSFIVFQVPCNNFVFETNIFRFCTVGPLYETFSWSTLAHFSLAHHKACLKGSILERMFDFKNLHKKLYFKNNMSKGKMTGMEKQTLISFYEDNVDPYYRNKVKRYLIKVKLVTLFEANL